MVDKTGIEWTDATWNPIRGCSRVSEGCRHCYAEAVAYRFSGPGLPYEGLAHKVNGHASWTGKVALAEKHLFDPLRWKTPRRIFVNSMSDVFHESVPDEWIDKIFAVMALSPQHTFQVLTKRPERMLKYFLTLKSVGDQWAAKIGKPFSPSDVLNLRWMHWRVNQGPAFPYGPWPLPNVHLGISCEDQATAGARIPLLLQTPAAVRFISAEPLLAPIELLWGSGWGGNGEPPLTDGIPSDEQIHGPNGAHFVRHGAGRLDWVIVGGESGPGARLCDVEWIRSIVQQCEAASVPVFVKQLGSHVIQGGERRIKKDRKGGDMHEWPHEIRVREFPEAIHDRIL